MDEAFKVLHTKPSREKLKKIFDMKFLKWQEGNKNFYFGDAYQQAISVLGIMMQNTEHQPKDLDMTGISFSEFENMFNEYLEKGRFEWFVAGNL